MESTQCNETQKKVMRKSYQCKNDSKEHKGGRWKNHTSLSSFFPFLLFFRSPLLLLLSHLFVFPKVLQPNFPTISLAFFPYLLQLHCTPTIFHQHHLCLPSITDCSADCGADCSADSGADCSAHRSADSRTDCTECRV